MPPNLLLLLSDEHNPRYMSRREEGGEPVDTPTLDSLAAEGTIFQQAYCPMPKCAPSRQCTLTGLNQQHVRAWDLFEPLKPSFETMPGQFAEAGYETALIGKMHFQGDRQFNGFKHRPFGDITGHDVQQPGHQPDPIHPEHLTTQPRHQGIDFRTRIPGAGVTEIPESQLQENIVVRETISFLREQRHAHPDQPWFVCASFSRPHFPLTAPRRHFERYWPDGVTKPTPRDGGDTADHPYIGAKGEREKTVDLGEDEMMRARAAYCACVDYLDEILGELLNVLGEEGFLDETIVVYTSDHGELAGEHSLWWKSTWHEGSARVPLTIRTHNHSMGDDVSGRIETPVSLIDLYPTLCELTGIEVPGDIDGTGLSSAVRMNEEPDRAPVFSDNFSEPFGEPSLDYRMIRDESYKYIGFRDAPEILYNIDADPKEQHNLAPDAEGEDAVALDRLRETVERTVDFDNIETKRRADRENRDQYELSIPTGTGNAYIMPDGRLVDAGTILYKPDVLATNPRDIFADWPEEDE